MGPLIYTMHIKYTFTEEWNDQQSPTSSTQIDSKVLSQIAYYFKNCGQEIIGSPSKTLSLFW